MPKVNPQNAYESSLESGEEKNGNVTNYVAKGSISNENIVTTRDRAALVFHEYVRNREWTTDWLAYLSTGIGLLVSLMTADFTGFKNEDQILMDGGTCRGIVISFCLLSFLAALICFCRRWVERDKLTCRYFLDQLRKSDVNVD